ncbi:protein indeterminate-domain 12 isoform X2 [Jatropha curcas]|uniref:protein indeterminate-domain 12 isoform X2 n=1 Tax=Jatropha curcas TaxID=180498 RepID=UPI0009D6C360|nr:protein indeterminate-domain 12 isoform X2 [Jatropha curcas]
MFPAAMSNSTSLSEEASVSSGNRVVQDFCGINPVVNQQQQGQKVKKKRSLPGNPDPDAEVIALSPKTLLATNRFVCEICNKGFQRDQNLQLHRRGHNLPWKLKQRNSKEIKKRAYVCPEPSCVHHHPSRALGDLTGIKKHYCRKHGEKKWKCEKCSKIYAVQSDWKAHSKTCGTREYRCDCGTLFSRKDSFITHRAFCDALAEESARLSAHQLVSANPTHQSSLLLQNPQPSLFPLHHQISLNPWDPLHHHRHQNPSSNPPQNPTVQIKPETHHFQLPSSLLFQEPSPFQTLSNPATSVATASHHLSATALLQKAATVGATQTTVGHSQMTQLDMTELGSADSVAQQHGSSFLGNLATWHKNDRLTRDFLGLTGDANGNVANGSGGGAAVNVSVNVREMLTYTGGVGLQQYAIERDHTLLKSHGFGFAQPPASETWGDC